MFYEPGRFHPGRRHPPPTTLSLLQDHGSVLTLDAEQHARRKEMFMAMMGPARLTELVELFETQWQRRLAPVAEPGQDTPAGRSGRGVCASVCEWAGLPQSERNRTC